MSLAGHASSPSERLSAHRPRDVLDLMPADPDVGQDPIVQLGRAPPRSRDTADAAGSGSEHHGTMRAARKLRTGCGDGHGRSALRGRRGDHMRRHDAVSPCGLRVRRVALFGGGRRPRPEPDMALPRAGEKWSLLQRSNAFSRRERASVGSRFLPSAAELALTPQAMPGWSGRASCCIAATGDPRREASRGGREGACSARSTQSAGSASAGRTGAAQQGKRDLAPEPLGDRELDPEHGKRLEQARDLERPGIDRLEPELGDQLQHRGLGAASSPHTNIAGRPSG